MRFRFKINLYDFFAVFISIHGTAEFVAKKKARESSAKDERKGNYAGVASGLSFCLLLGRFAESGARVKKTRGRI